MAYDALAESVDLIERRLLPPVRRLSRRRRFAAMSVDVADDVAVTTFARRGAGCTWHETHVLVRRKGRWALLGGGGSNADEDLLADRPAVLPETARSATGTLSGAALGPLVVNGSGGVHDGGGRPGRWPWSGRWISYAGVLVNADVHFLSVADRLLTVPWHGRVAVAWTTRRSPLVAALDRHGRLVGTVHTAPTRPGQPAAYPDAGARKVRDVLGIRARSASPGVAESAD